jgi:hypothetical protein
MTNVSFFPVEIFLAIDGNFFVPACNRVLLVLVALSISMWYSYLHTISEFRFSNLFAKWKILFIIWTGKTWHNNTVLSILTDAMAILAREELLLNMGLLMCICDYNFSLDWLKSQLVLQLPAKFARHISNLLGWWWSCWMEKWSLKLENSMV